MVEVIKSKDVLIETYDADYEELIGNGTRIVFGVPGQAVNTDPKFSRAYAAAEEVTISTITAGAPEAISGSSITVTNGSITVTGNGTSFITQIAPGNMIKLDSIGTYYKVKSIESDTLLTLVDPHTGNGTGAGTVKGTKVTLSSAPANGTVTELYVPTTKNPVFTTQQDIRYNIITNVMDLRILGTDYSTKEVIEKTGTLELALAQAKNHTVLSKLALNNKNDTWMVVAIKYLNTSPVVRHIFKEARIKDLTAGAQAGEAATERVTFHWDPPLDIASTTPSYVLIENIVSYDDAALYGTPKIILFLVSGNYYYAKAYPTISSQTGGSGDPDVEDIIILYNADLFGTPRTAHINTNSIEYYFKIYPGITASQQYSGTKYAQINTSGNSTLSGAPRVIKCLIDGIPYYTKVYPSKV